MVDVKAGASPGPNLAVIPDGWNLNGYYPTYEGVAVAKYIYVDYAVTHNGHPSLRLDKGGWYDPTWKVWDRGTWARAFPVKQGDHVVVKIWIKMGPSSWGSLLGGKIGVDKYRYGAIIAPAFEPSPEYVHWGSDWTQQVVDFIVPAGVDHVVPWIQAREGKDLGSAWFADAEFYINPSIVPPTLTPPPTTSPSPIIGDSYAITNQNDATLLTAIYPSSTNARSAGGQCFTGLAGYKLTSAQFALSKIGNPSGNLVATLYALTGTFGTNGRPTGTTLAMSNTVAMSSVSGWPMTMVTFTFPQPYTLSNGYYCLAIQAFSGSLFSGGNCILIGYDNSSPTHAGNYFIYANNGWTGYQSLDGCFSVSLTP